MARPSRGSTGHGTGVSPGRSTARSIAVASLLAVALSAWPGRPGAATTPVPAASVDATPGSHARPALTWRRVGGPVPAAGQDDVYSADGMDIASNAAGTLVVLWWVWAEDHDGPLWTSPDGETWTEIREPWTERIADLVGQRDGFLAVGDDTVWWSADGTEWSVRARIPGGSLRLLAAAGDVVVVAGEMAAQDGTARTWVSEDAGITWEDRAVPAETWVDRIAVSADGTIVVLLTAADPRDQDFHHELWVVGDGQPAEVRLPGSRYNISSLSWTSAGFVLTTEWSRRRKPLATTLWRSMDGRSWNRAHAIKGTTAVIREAGGELLWFGDVKQGKTYEPWVGTSADGMSWRFDPAPAFESGFANSVTAAQGRIYVTGTSWVDHGSYESESAALWIGERAADGTDAGPGPAVASP